MITLITHEVKYNRETNRIEEFKEFNNGKLVAFEIYYPNGNLKSKKDNYALTNYDENGNLHEPRIRYVDGKTFTKTLYVHGKRNGIYIKYCTRTQVLDMICEYKNDVKHGIERAYYGNRQLWYEKNFHEGEEQPKTTIYEPDGKIVFKYPK